MTTTQVTAAGERNAELIRSNFERFLAGDVAAVLVTWADHAVWHILDCNRYEGEYTKHEYFALLTKAWVEDVSGYELRVLSVQPFGDHLVVVHVESSGTTIDGPIDPGGGLMIYRLDDGLIVEGWAVSKGQDATTAF